MRLLRLRDVRGSETIIALTSGPWGASYMQETVMRDQSLTGRAEAYAPPMIKDHGRLRDITAGCVGGVPADSMAGADLETFPANSGLFCGP
jgi:hypothetical protein